jgi:hypothetical protein
MPDNIITVLMSDGPGSINELDKAIEYIKYKLLPYEHTQLLKEFFTILDIPG